MDEERQSVLGMLVERIMDLLRCLPGPGEGAKYWAALRVNVKAVLVEADAAGYLRGKDHGKAEAVGFMQERMSRLASSSLGEPPDEEHLPIGQILLVVPEEGEGRFMMTIPGALRAAPAGLRLERKWGPSIWTGVWLFDGGGWRHLTALELAMEILR